ncbi:MAG TPA: excinuclease ABC subunit UvrA [Phycisphaerae bacterium]|nr:excinuclease ABC subunit UvrA [Phycisphaerae bacterium]
MPVKQGKKGGAAAGRASRQPLGTSPRAAAGASEPATPWLIVCGAAHNNLKKIDVEIPLGRFVCITGVSGSGKSSLVNDILREQLARDLNGALTADPGAHRAIEGKQHLDKVIDIDQSPIGRTPRSNAATYIKLFDEIRTLFAKLPDSKVRGYEPGRFSFNVATGEQGGGRCEACEGNGQNRVEMDFLADVWTTCPVCEGRRFNHETLQIHYRGKSIYDVLEMDVQQALEHFQAIPKIREMLATLHDVGLDYLKIGQPSTTLSGGEAQRIKLARELVRRSTGRTLYILDEPTTGLHFEDIRRLLAVLHGFVDGGNSVIVIEHNLDVIKTADWVIDLGPEGGAGGGEVVATGTPEDIARCADSFTGQALADVLLEKSKRQKVKTPKPRNSKSPNRQITRSPHSRDDAIVVVGAKEHNLKDVTVRIPRGAMTICSGVSGSGKTSFAMDTVYVEGQRRYVESLSSYARQFLGQFQKPKVDHVYGLSPAIAIEQKAASNTPRSTVGTVTEIYDYMRVLWARVGQPYCPKCDIPIGTQSSQEIIDRICGLPEGTRVLLCAPVERSSGESWESLLARCEAQGYVRARIDGEVVDISSKPKIDARRAHDVELVVDRAVIKAGTRGRMGDSIEHALSLGKGILVAVIIDPASVSPPLASSRLEKRPEKPSTTEAPENSRILRFSQHFSCERCGTSYDELTPHHFSFNSRLGWCESCEGLGFQRGTSADAVIINPHDSILDGAIAGWQNAESNPLLRGMIVALARVIAFDSAAPLASLNEAQRRSLLYGLGDRWIEVDASPGVRGLRFQWKGFFPAIDEATKNSFIYRQRLADSVTEIPCQTCGAARVRPEARAVRLGDRRIGEVCGLELTAAADYFKSLKLSREQARVAGELLHEIKSRLQFLIDVGLGYVTIGRSAPTLSGGESQRIRLASQIGSGLTGVLYVLDEPTIGLHPRDNKRLIGALQKLRDLGNTLLMVEHDEEILRSADHLIDFGPGAGSLGGHVVGSGAPAILKKNKESLTGQYLAGTTAIPVPTNRRPIKGFKERAAAGEAIDHQSSERPVLSIIGASQNNLRGVDVQFPLGRFVCVTGVSGSGKSSLVTDILYPALASRIHRAAATPGRHREIRGIEFIDKTINVDQQPIGMSPSSNPATYTGVFDLVREVFAKMPESKVRGFTVNKFSFNRPGGRCEACEGMGQVCHEMHFLPDVWVPCEDCGAKRYQKETLEVRYKGRNIAEVLEMTVAEALAHFLNVPKIRRLLQTLADVGLDYLPLGQSAPTLSGGEAQRVKLAGELGRPSTGRTMYVLDEPTTGLHFDDLRKLLDVLHRLVDLGNSVVCIEHNLDVVKTADWIIDLGPEAGDEGGRIVAEGPPEDVALVAASHTGRLLQPLLVAGPHAERPVFDPKKAAAKQLDSEAAVGAIPDAGVRILSPAGARIPSRTSVTPSDDRLIIPEGHDVKMPWQRDGKKWHTRERLSRDGQPVEWEGPALNFVIDTIEKLGRKKLLETDWNDRARVEIAARAPQGVAQTAVPWLLHALTAGRWLLDLLFRVPRGTFKEPALASSLRLKSLDERDDIQAYGSTSRVQIRHARDEFDQIRILVHDKKEIDTPAFRKFLSDALDSYLTHVEALAESDSGGELWKTDGKTWHLSQKIMRPGQPKLWKPMTLTLIVGQMSKILPKAKVFWDRKVFVELTAPDGRRIGKIITHQADAMRIDLHIPRGRFTPTQVEGLGFKQEFGRTGASGAEISFWCRTIEEIRVVELKALLEAAWGDQPP